MEKTTDRILKKLNEMEVTWTAEQKIAWRSKIEAGAKKARALEYKDILLAKCREHTGPFVNTNEVNVFVKNAKNESEKKKAIRQETSVPWNNEPAPFGFK